MLDLEHKKFDNSLEKENEKRIVAGQTGPQECAGCGKKIHDKFILKVTFEDDVVGIRHRLIIISYML